MFSRYQGIRGINLGEHFQANGWYTARIGKIFHMRVPGDIINGTNGNDFASAWTERFNSPGLEAHTPGEYACLNLNVYTTSLADRQSTAMPHRMFVSVQYDGDGSDQPDHKSASQAIRLLSEHRNEPFLLAVGLVRPHYPMVAPRQYFQSYDWRDIALPEQVAGDLDDVPPLGLGKTLSHKNPIGKFPDNQRRMWAAYYASVTFMDDQVGRMVRELERLGIRDSTAIVFTSDHGYHLGEHGFWQKANLHDQVLRVPLIVAAPGYVPGRTNSIVELLDIYPTLCELTGIKRPATVQGESLVPLLSDPHAQAKSNALSFTRSGASLLTDRWHYMRYNDDTAELYDRLNDRNQFTNLATNPAYTDVVKELSVTLSRRLNEIRSDE